MPRFHHADLLAFGQALLNAAGIPEADAQLTAGLLLKADLHGYPGHGITHIDSYVERVRVGLIRLDGVPTVVREGKSTAVMDGGFYVGQVVAHRAMNLAIQKAEAHGIGMVAVRHSSHVGRVADYVEMAAESGKIGFATVSVGGGNIAPYGGMEPVAGTNPVAYGIPGPDGEHIVFDCATSMMSMGELLRHVARKEPIPEGVMLDGYGHPTTEYEAFRGPPRGVMLPFGGHKGSGFHIMAEIFGGALTGNGIGRDWLDKGASAVNGAIFEAIDVEEFQPLDEFRERIAALAAFVRSRKPAPGFDHISLPGDGARRRREQTLANGVDLDDAGWKHLIECAESLTVTNLPKPVGT